MVFEQNWELISLTLIYKHSRDKIVTNVYPYTHAVIHVSFVAKLSRVYNWHVKKVDWLRAGRAGDPIPVGARFSALV
jgi:hypothetical protein